MSTWLIAPFSNNEFMRNALVALSHARNLNEPLMIERAP